MPVEPKPLRIFLDAGVLIDGHFNRWGVCKALVILLTLRHRFQAVLAEPVKEEFDRNLARKTADMGVEDARSVLAGVERWAAICRPEQIQYPTVAEMEAHAYLFAAVRHRNDMPAVVAAVLARPDWVLSTNTDHWNEDLAARTGLRIVTPLTFLGSLQPASLD